MRSHALGEKFSAAVLERAKDRRVTGRLKPMTSAAPVIEATLMNSRRLSFLREFIGHLLPLRLDGLPGGSDYTFRICRAYPPLPHLARLTVAALRHFFGNPCPLHRMIPLSG
jgi:hypothetical protein